MELNSYEQKPISLSEQYRAFLDNIRKKYGFNYIAKMSTEEQEEYISMYSTLYQVSKEEVRNNINQQLNKTNNQQIDDPERILTSRNRVFEETLAIGKNNPNAMSTVSTSVYRITQMDQIEDIMNCGYVRPKEGSLKGGHKNEIFWTKGGEKLFYFGSSGVILEAPEEKVKNNQIGAIPFEDLIGIWTFDEEQNKYVNNIEYFKNLYQEKRSSVAKTVSLESIMPIIREEGFSILGHGTGAGNTEVLDSIFATGLRASHSSILYTTSNLNPHLNINDFQSVLEHWDHNDSENIVILKLPTEFMCEIGNEIDLGCEKTGAFVTEVVKEDGTINYYLNPKFILGSYNRNTKQVTMNPNFEMKLTAETLKELQEKYQINLKKIEEKNKSIENGFFQPINQSNNVTFQVETATPTFDMNTTLDDMSWDEETQELGENRSVRR